MATSSVAFVRSSDPDASRPAVLGWTGGAASARLGTEQLVERFLDRRKASTIRAYRQDLADFQTYVAAHGAAAAAGFLIAQGAGEANALVLAYQGDLHARGLAPSTVNRRIASLRSLVKLARMLGLVSWSVEVENIPAAAYRDTRGPGRDGYLELLQKLNESAGVRIVRNRALVRLHYDVALRRGEIERLDLDDVDLEGARIWILGKGRMEKEAVTLPAPTARAIAAWIQVRGTDPGPLFRNLDRAHRHEARNPERRLTGTSIYRIIRALGYEVGREVRPHGLRHAAITEALDRTQGDVRKVQKFSRHKKLDTLMIYDDNRRDLGGEVATLIAEE